jgi:hypothetical protein
MKSEWVIQTNAKNEKNATVLFNRFGKRLNANIVNYQCMAHGGAGYKVLWTVEHGDLGWSDGLLHALQLAQNVGNGWLLTGDVNRDYNGWCNRPKVAGVQTIEWTMTRAGSDLGL